MEILLPLPGGEQDAADVNAWLTVDVSENKSDHTKFNRSFDIKKLSVLHEEHDALITCRSVLSLNDVSCHPLPSYYSSTLLPIYSVISILKILYFSTVT